MTTGRALDTAMIAVPHLLGLETPFRSLYRFVGMTAIGQHFPSLIIHAA
jgi:hypothetical protein